MKPMKNVESCFPAHLRSRLPGQRSVISASGSPLARSPQSGEPEWKISESMDCGRGLALLVAIPLAATVIVLHFI